MIDTTKYSELLGLDATQAKRVKEVLSILQLACPGTIEAIFISQAKAATGAGDRPSSLWAFGPNFLMEAKNFMSELAFDNVALDKNIVRWEMTARDYSPGAPAKAEAFLKVELSFPKVSGEFTAFGANASVLWELFLKRFSGHLAPR